MRTVIPSNPAEETSLLLEVTDLANRFAGRLADPDDADDLAQQTVLECLARLRGERWRVRKSLRGLVRSMVRHRWIRNQKRAKCRAALDAWHLDDLTDSAPVWMDSEAMLELSEAETIRAQALAELPERCCEAYRLVREERATYRDVAATLGISVGLVANYMRNAERHLSSRMLHSRMPSQSAPRAARRPPEGRPPATNEAPRRRVSIAAQPCATVRSGHATVRSARARHMYAEPTATSSRRMAIVAEPTPTWEEASPTLG